MSTPREQAIQHWSGQLDARQAALAGPEWLDAHRHRAMERFREQGLPGRRTEGWRHTNLVPLARVAFEGSGELPTVDADALPRIEGAVRLVFVGGRLQRDLSDELDVDGLEIGSLREVFTQARAQELLELDLPSVNGPLAELNTALMEDGAVLRTAKNADIATPIHLVHVTHGDGAPTSSHARHLVQVATGSRLTLVEHHVHAGEPGAERFAQVVTDVVVHDGGHLERLEIQDEGPGTFHVGDLRVRLCRDARVRSYSFTLGGRLARTGVHVTLDGPGAECELFGLYLGQGSEHHDHTSRIVHAAPHTTSRELFKGILDGSSRGVFTGVIEVGKDAQKTVSEQSNRNLLVSETAQADSEPMLEIHADDVKCAHGSAIGQIDDDVLFYLRSRGIDEGSARQLLTAAFAGEVVDAITGDVLREHVRERVVQWLGQARFGQE